MAESIRGSKALVAGSTGLIGSNLILRLLSEGAEVRGTLHRRPPTIDDPAVEYIHADLTSMDDCRRVVEGCRYVFMCAANTSGAAVMKKTPLVHVTPNVVMNAQLLQAAYDAGVEKFVWIGSSAAYPPTGDRPVREEEMFDGDPYEAYYFVGWMKRFGETLCRMYGEKLDPSMTTIVLRPSNIYGPYDDYDPATSHVTAALIRKVVERQSPIEVWGSGEDVRDVIHVDDMIDAMVMAVENLNSQAALNIGLGTGYSVKEILSTLLEVDGYEDAEVVLDPSKPSMIPVRLVATDRAEAEMGFRARVGLREGLTRAIDWYRRFGAPVS